MKTLWKSLTLVIIALLIESAAVLADTGRRDYAFGWQFSKSASGLSLKIPVRQDFYVQPIVAFTMNERSTTAKGHFAYGLRGTYDFPSRNDYHPYAGIALGHSAEFGNATGASINRGSSGYEAFFGVEYQKYLLRPALEVGMGNYNRTDGSQYAGLTVNLSLLYYF